MDVNERQRRIREAFTTFEGNLRLARWRAIDDALEGAGERQLTSAERDEIDLATAMGLVPFSDGEGHDDG